MSRKVVGLTSEHLAALPAPARECVFWEVDPVRRARTDATQAAALKQQWLRDVLSAWGTCGQVLLVDGRPRGLVTYAPGRFLPGADALPTAPPSPDAVLMATVYVDDDLRGGGLGRMLIQGMARDLVTREVRAVEAFGRQGGADGDCVLPSAFLAAVGFHTQRAHPYVVRMRMDLKATRSWRRGVGQALGRLVGGVRAAEPAVSPEARGLETAQRSTAR